MICFRRCALSSRSLRAPQPHVLSEKPLPTQQLCLAQICDHSCVISATQVRAHTRHSGCNGTWAASESVAQGRRTKSIETHSIVPHAITDVSSMNDGRKTALPTIAGLTCSGFNAVAAYMHLTCTHCGDSKMPCKALSHAHERGRTVPAHNNIIWHNVYSFGTAGR